MSEKRDLSDLLDEELVAELARRRAEGRLELDNLALRAVDGAGCAAGGGAGDAGVSGRACGAADDGEPAVSPVRGAVRRQSVARTVRSRHGEHRLARHYHYCPRCAQGFYPLDVALGLGDEGELTSRMKQVVLDLGLHGTFEEAGERFALHHGGTISENLVRRVVDRVGRGAQTHPHLGAHLRASAAQPPWTIRRLG